MAFSLTTTKASARASARRASARRSAVTVRANNPLQSMTNEEYAELKRTQREANEASLEIMKKKAQNTSAVLQARKRAMVEGGHKYAESRIRNLAVSNMGASENVKLPMMSEAELAAMSVEDLKSMASSAGLTQLLNLKSKEGLVIALAAAASAARARAVRARSAAATAGPSGGPPHPSLTRTPAAPPSAPLHAAG
eukprot:CAMPEP_0183789820 /NCGR_PEP_ID=MMETSP0803_2-20130417/663_1 /TAXON_ID=195967 /ORGANISM="Crustomastix stigmata, Strain CCMP3273" /LENGTH=195 /DNA_ID=CAMNT_0026034001 /DNA_START=41 /DNA_END=625 /DNA_ORIENTATION=+